MVSGVDSSDESYSIAKRGFSSVESDIGMEE